MQDRRMHQRTRALRGGRILFNEGRSAINCMVRNESEQGLCLQVDSPIGIPFRFDLLIDGEAQRPCKLIWQSDNRIGVAFDKAFPHASPRDHHPHTRDAVTDRRVGNDGVHGELMRLRAALDEVKIGIVLLDAEMRAQFINRAFRKMWRLPDAKADMKPPFVALMYHGRDMLAYDVPDDEIDAYVAERVAHVKSGAPMTRNIRLRNGEVLRLQCSVLPDGGRMLSYTFVTDIVRHSDESEDIRAALDTAEHGVVLLDSHFNATFMNRAVRRLWNVSDEEAGRKPPYSQLVNRARVTRIYGVPPEQLDAFIASRIAQVKSGDPRPVDLPVRGGRTVRVQCAVLPNGGRMLTYHDVTDLVHSAEAYENRVTHRITAAE